jgi:hypothetical protein
MLLLLLARHLDYLALRVSTTFNTDPQHLPVVALVQCKLILRANSRPNQSMLPLEANPLLDLVIIEATYLGTCPCTAILLVLTSRLERLPKMLHNGANRLLERFKTLHRDHMALLKVKVDKLSSIKIAHNLTNKSQLPLGRTSGTGGTTGLSRERHRPPKHFVHLRRTQAVAMECPLQVYLLQNFTPPSCIAMVTSNLTILLWHRRFHKMYISSHRVRLFLLTFGRYVPRKLLTLPDIVSLQIHDLTPLCRQCHPSKTTIWGALRLWLPWPQAKKTRLRRRSEYYQAQLPRWAHGPQGNRTHSSEETFGISFDSNGRTSRNLTTYMIFMRSNESIMSASDTHERGLRAARSAFTGV